MIYSYKCTIYFVSTVYCNCAPKLSQPVVGTDLTAFAEGLDKAAQLQVSFCVCGRAESKM